MNLTDVPDIIYNFIAENLPPEIPPERFTIMSGNIPDDDTETPGLILTHVPAPGAITTLGGPGVCRRRLRTGVVFLQVRTPLGYGNDALAISIAERIADLFEGRWEDLPLIYKGGIDVRPLGRDGAWYLCNCVLTYEFETVK